MHLKVNTAGNSDGIMQMWVNGTLMIDLDNRPWVGTADAGAEFYNGRFDHWYGGGDMSWVCPQDQFILTDKIILSTSKIT